MKKSKIVGSTILACLIAILLGAKVALPISAQEATATISSETNDETTQNLKDRIEKVVQERKDQIKEKIDALSTQKRGFIGQIQRVSEEAITIKNVKGTQILAIDEDVELLKKSKDISLSDIAVDNWVVVMGLLEEDNFTPKRILVSDTTLRPKQYKIALGSIESLSSREIIIFPRSGDDSVTYTITSKTDFEDLEGNPIVFADLTTEMQALVVGYEDEDDNTKTATIIRTLTVTIDE